jgi:hypothetical protein
MLLFVGCVDDEAVGILQRKGVHPLQTILRKMHSWLFRFTGRGVLYLHTIVQALEDWQFR